MSKTIKLLSVAVVLFAVLVSTAAPVSAVDTGFFFANSTVTDSSVDSQDNGWTSNDSWAGFNNSSDTADYGFADLSIPAGATIDGIEVTIEGQRNGGFSNRNLTAALWNTSNSNPDAYTTSKTATLTDNDSTQTLGGATDKWGRTWTVADFADATFKIRVGNSGSFGDAALDAVRVKVYYTPAAVIPPAPTILSGPGEGATIIADSTSIAFSATGAVTFECQLDAGAFALCTTPHALNSLSQGAHSFSVRGINASGTGPATTRNFSVDSIAPSPTVASFPTVVEANENSVPLSGACEDGLAISLSVGSENESPSCVGGAWSQNMDLSVLADGPLTANISQTDTAGNTGNGTLGSVKDTAVPSLTLTSTSTELVGGAFTVSAAFSEPVTGFEAADIELGNGTISNFSGAGAAYSFTVTPLIPGTVTVDADAGVAQDGLGNGNTAALQLERTYNDTVFNKGILTFSFDDGFKSIFSNIGLLNDFKSTQFVYSVPIIGGGTYVADYMTPANLLTLQSAGHEISSHTRGHQNIPGLANESAQLLEVNGSRLDILQTFGIAPTGNFAYPFGAYDDDVVAQVKAAGYSGARTVQFISELGQPMYNFQTSDRYRLSAMMVNENTPITSTDAPLEYPAGTPRPEWGYLEQWVDEAIEQHGWLVFVFHHVKADCGADPDCITPSKLSQIVDYVESKGTTVDVVTMGEGLSQMDSAPVHNADVPDITIAEEVAGTVSAAATSTAGAAVTYTATVADADTTSAPLSAYCTIPAEAEYFFDGGIGSGVSFPTVAMPGSWFPIGSTQVTCKAADAGGVVGTHVFTVTVTDMAPIIESHADVIASASDANGALVDYGTPTATDAVDGLVAVNCVPATNTVFPIGSTTVNCTATDSHANVASSSFTVTVVDTKPVITLNPTDPQVIEVGTAYSELGATTADAVDGAGVVTEIDASTVNVAVVGSYSVRYNALDTAGNPADEVIRTVNVVDTQKPVITLNPGNPQVIEVGLEVYSELGATALDNYDGDLTGSITIDSSDVNVAALGEYTVRYNATDSSNNAADEVTRSVQVVDSTAPVIATPSIVEPVEAPLGAIEVVYDMPAVSDNSSEAIVATCLPASGSVFAFGTTEVTCSATDSSGNEAAPVMFTVEVTDGGKPEAVISTTVGSPTNTSPIPVTVTFNEPVTGFSEDDLIVTGGSVNDFVGDDTVFTFTVEPDGELVTVTVDLDAGAATDIADNPSEAADELSVDYDETAPGVSITAPAANDVTFTGTADDDVVSVLVKIDGTSEGEAVITDGTWEFTLVAPLAEGVYEVTAFATDGLGNTAETLPVTLIVDNSAPVITLDGDNPVIVDFNSVYTDAGATVTDNLDAGVTVNGDASSVNTSVLGPYQVSYTSTDWADNTATAYRDVTVADLSAPVITLNGSSVITLAVGQEYSELGATAEDNYDELVEVSITGDVLVGPLAEGTYVVNYNAADAAGNDATEVTRTVQVTNLEISEQAASAPAQTSFTVNWTTSHPATSRVVYDTVSHPEVDSEDANYGYAFSTVEDAAMVTEHSVLVSGLTANTTYFFRTVSHGSPEVVSGTEGSQKTAAKPASGGGGGGAVSTPKPSSTPTPSPSPTPQVLGATTTVADPQNLTTYSLNEGDVISAAGSNDPDVYIVNEWGYKRLFLNPAIFGFYGHLGGWQNVKTVTPAARDAFPTSGIFRNCESGDQKVYAVQVTGEDTGTLHWINMSGDAAVAQDPDFFRKVFCVNNNEFSWYTLSPTAYTSLTQVPVYNRE